MDVLQLVKNPKVVMGLVISIAGIYWAFRDFQFQGFKESIQEVDLFYLILATFFLWSSVWLRGIRWKMLFKKNNSPTITSLYRAELIGYFGNNVLPLRLGELLRSYLVAKEYDLSTSFIFGTVVLERLLDTFVLGSFAILLLLIYPLESVAKIYVMWGGIGTFVLIILLFIINRLHLIQSKNKIWISVNIFLDGLLSIRKGMLIPIVILSFFIWCIYWLDVFLIQKAFQFNLTNSQTLTVLVISSLALSIPSAPGMFGTFHAAVKFTMVDLFSYSSNAGDAFAILMHAYGYLLLTSLGAYYFMKNQFHYYALDAVLQTKTIDD